MSDNAPSASLGVRAGKFVKQNFVGFIVGLGLLAWPTYTTYRQAEHERVQALRIAEYNSIAQEQRKFYELLDPFTYDIAQGKPPSSALKKELTSSLVRQYHSIGAFTVNIPPSQGAAFAEYQSSLNEVKKELQQLKSLKGMDAFGLALVDMQRNLKRITPSIEAAVGRPEIEANLQPAQSRM